MLSITNGPQEVRAFSSRGGTSLSKAYGLIERFSEDIDITVFRNDLDESASVEELEIDLVE
ncbi:putative nucleotidyltransferase component of viral defense system [Bradyrhizobium elkanii]